MNNPSANAEDIRDPWLGKIPWRRAWQPTPVFLPGEPHGQRSLVGYSSWGREELDTTEATEHTCTTVCQRVPFALHPANVCYLCFFGDCHFDQCEGLICTSLVISDAEFLICSCGCWLPEFPLWKNVYSVLLSTVNQLV